MLYPAFASRAHQSTLGAVPGSLIRLSGGPFEDRQILTGEGRRFPVVAITQDAYEAQIPWDYNVADTKLTLSMPETPFVIRETVILSPGVYPAVYTNGRGEAKAARQDFSSLVSKDRCHQGRCPTPSAPPIAILR